MFSDGHHAKEPLICVVCGSMARGFNFGALTCMSCKVFFRRNAFTTLSDLSCRDEGHCQITNQTRKYCTYCRLRTCFRVGMRRELFRMKVNEIQRRKPIRFTGNRTINFNLFSCWSDPSILSNNDWLLLHRLSSTFDSLNDQVISKVHEIHQQLSSIGIQPLKIRVKAIYIYDMVNTFAKIVLAFVKSIPQFISLPRLNQQLLLIRNIKPMILFYAYYQMNFEPVESLTKTSYWTTVIECLLLPSTKHFHNTIKSLVGCISSMDPYFIQFILILLAFSTNNLHQIQNTYAELMWKYILHRFGEVHGISLYSRVIQNILQIQSIISLMKKSRTICEEKFFDDLIKSIDDTLQLNTKDSI